ncbi:MAG: glycosyltransferase family 4 protein [Dysgonamonadaceae bacterium]|jgi:glycosyltransferase involved in cell wall biosynthesis|nr:glycosyltransferase family 4 protein [Dysgonamonadaceae bacterium]
MEELKPKIVYLLPGGLSNSGGMERVVTIKANYLAEKMNYDVSIVTTEQIGTPVFYPLSPQVHLYHLEIGIYVNFGKESYVEKLISRYKKIKEYKHALKKLLDDIRPDITISTLGLDIEFINRLNDGSIKIGELHFPGNYRYLMARQMYHSPIPIFVEQVRTRKLRNDCKKLSRLVVLTKEERMSWKNERNVEIIPNPLSFIPDKVSDCTAKKAIAVGRLVYEKGFDQLIEAWRIVHRTHPDWTLSIFGGGSQKEKLNALIRQYGLEPVITIFDPVKDIHAEFLKHSVMLFPSRCLDALPMVLIEAMSCGLPLVAFDAPCGPKDIITDGENGFLVKAGDIAALSDKIIAMIESETLRVSMGKAARTASYNYTEEKVMALWLQLFRELMNNQSSWIN